jgi:hypothetical protein
MVGIAMVKLDEYITDTLMRDLVGHDRRPVSFLVYLWLVAEQQRRATANSPSRWGYRRALRKRQLDG